MAVVDSFFFKVFGWFVIDKNDAKNHAIHFFMGAFFTCLFKGYSWGWIGILIYGLYSLVQEFIFDGHLVRLIKFTESKAEFVDMLKDIFSRTVGILFYLLK